MKRLIAIALFILALSTLAQAQTSQKRTPRSLEGTRWEGTVRAPDSEGTLDNYEYVFEFLGGGRLRVTNNGQVYDSVSIWKQIGNGISMEVNNGYTLWMGLVEGSQMSGMSANKIGYSWTWRMTEATRGTRNSGRPSAGAHSFKRSSARSLR